MAQNYGCRRKFGRRIDVRSLNFVCAISSKVLCVVACYKLVQSSVSHAVEVVAAEVVEFALVAWWRL